MDGNTMRQTTGNVAKKQRLMRPLRMYSRDCPSSTHVPPSSSGQRSALCTVLSTVHHSYIRPPANLGHTFNNRSDCAASNTSMPQDFNMEDADALRIFRALEYPYPTLRHSFTYSSHKIMKWDHRLYSEPKYVCVLAIGSNASPFQLGRKFDSDTVPVPQLTAHGLDVVYSQFMCSYGAIPATIVKSKGTKVHLHANMLTQEQLMRMHATEGGYEFCKLITGRDVKVVRDDGVEVGEVYCYVTDAYSKDGKHVALKASIAEDRVYKELSQREIQKMLMREVKNVEDAGESDLQEFVRENVCFEQEKPSACSVRRESINKILEEGGAKGEREDCWEVLDIVLNGIKAVE